MGLNKSPLTMDPAMIKYNDMMVNRYKYFRWTPRTAGITFVYAIVVPALIGIVAYKYDGKWEMRGKRRGDPIAEW